MIAPDSPVLSKSLADYYHVEMARTEDAANLYSKIVELQPNEVPILLRTANFLVSLKRFGETATHYHLVLNIEPWNTEASETLQKLKRIRIGVNGKSIPEERHAGAQRIINQGNEVTIGLQAGKTYGIPNHPEFASANNNGTTHYDLGALAYQAGEKDKALHHYEEAARLQPGNHTFQMELEDYYWMEQGRTEDALRIYVRILETHPNDIATLMALVRVCGSLSRMEGARAFYMRVLEIAPWNTDAQNGMQELQRGSPCIAPAAAQSPQNLYNKASRLISAGDTTPGRDRLLQLVTL